MLAIERILSIPHMTTSSLLSARQPCLGPAQGTSAACFHYWFYPKRLTIWI
jgi:hypothetical protein